MKPPAHKRGHPTLQNMNFFYFCGSFLPSWIRIRIRIQITDPEPDPLVRLNTDPIRIRIRNPASLHCCGSGSVESISQSYGSRSGSFYHQAKIVRKKLIHTVLWLFNFKKFVNEPSESNKQKNHVIQYWYPFQFPWYTLILVYNIFWHDLKNVLLSNLLKLPRDNSFGVFYRCFV
jgi:hypothetical protein